MGKPMAQNLIKAGFPLVVHNRSRAAVDELVAAGARGRRVAGRRREAVDVRHHDAAGHARRRARADRRRRRPGGPADPARSSIDMSSISPTATERLAALVAAKGASMLDAPVSGGEIGAINGTLSIMVGGDEVAFERARPVFEAMGNKERIVHIGRSGAGQVCKICNQIAIGGALAGVSEAFALAKKAGVDPSRVRAALLGGFAASRVLEVHGERMLTGNYKPGFRAKLYQKDLRLAGEAAAANSVAMPGTAIVTQHVNALVAAGGGDLDYAAIATVLFNLARTSQ